MNASFEPRDSLPSGFDRGDRGPLPPARIASIGIMVFVSVTIVFVLTVLAIAHRMGAM